MRMLAGEPRMRLGGRRPRPSLGPRWGEAWSMLPDGSGGSLLGRLAAAWGASSPRVLVRSSDRVLALLFSVRRPPSPRRVPTRRASACLSSSSSATVSSALGWAVSGPGRSPRIAQIRVSGATGQKRPRAALGGCGRARRRGALGGGVRSRWRRRGEDRGSRGRRRLWIGRRGRGRAEGRGRGAKGREGREGEGRGEEEGGGENFFMPDEGRWVHRAKATRMRGRAGNCG